MSWSLDHSEPRCGSESEAAWVSGVAGAKARSPHTEGPPSSVRDPGDSWDPSWQRRLRDQALVGAQMSITRLLPPVNYRSNPAGLTVEQQSGEDGSLCPSELYLLHALTSRLGGAPGAAWPVTAPMGWRLPLFPPFLNDSH